ncbi:MAG: DUF3244 domain-containing protein [Bacteroides sp.]|nr:DUF3244 domain-containing protein [Bacteroides sp.]
MKKKWSLRMVAIIAILMNVLLVHAKYAEDTKAVELRGDWVETRSLISDCPITVFTDGAYIYIQNESPDRDITIRITNERTGNISHEETIPYVQTAYITIPIASYPSGTYQIEIIGSPMGYLSGDFTKN